MNWRVGWMVHIALHTIVFLCRGPLEFVCNALEFENLPIGDSKTFLHVVPISRLHEFAMDAKRVGFSLVEVAVDRVASFR